MQIEQNCLEYLTIRRIYRKLIYSMISRKYVQTAIIFMKTNTTAF